MKHRDESGAEFLEEADGAANLKALRAGVIQGSAHFDPKTYEVDLSVREDRSKPMTIRSMKTLMEVAKDNPAIEIDSRVLAIRPDGSRARVRLRDKKALFEAAARTEAQASSGKLREGFDSFLFDASNSNRGNAGDAVGSDSISMIGGPFNKQLYGTDHIQAHNLSFYAYHHDPIANATCNIMRDFTMGRGFRVDCDDPQGDMLWRLFEEANNLQECFDLMALEASIYGENMWWWLPNRWADVAYQVRPGQQPPTVMIPRVRMVDPSCIWEIVTYPEDINRVLFYQWVAPTQYQMYTGSDGGSSVPGSKFISMQIPAEEMMHFRLNRVSNEKRGRSDLFPALGSFKRLRDSVNYSIIGMQKRSAWAIDTSIDGNQGDIENYMAQQESLGTIAAPGSEFVHSTKVIRKFLVSEGAASDQSQSFEWNLSMIAAGVGIPVAYYGTHLSGSGTRGNAIVATEPVAKRFQGRQLYYERQIRAMAKKLFSMFGVKADIRVTFPEIIIQDSTTKIKNLQIGSAMGAFSHQRICEAVAKELSQQDYDYEKEQAKIKSEAQAGPLIQPVMPPNDSDPKSNAGMASSEKEDIKNGDRNL